MVSISVDDLKPQHQPRPKEDPEQEAFVKDMVSPEHCLQPPAVRVFVGYLGISPRDISDDGDGAGADGDDDADLPGKWVRLYRTLDFTDFIEVKWKDVIYHKKSTAAMLPIEGTILWVRNDAKIWHTQVQSMPVVASDFLKGPIAQQQMPAAQPSTGQQSLALVDTPSWGQPC